MVVIQTLGEPPSMGNMILATSNCIENSKKAEIVRVEIYMKFTSMVSIIGRLYILLSVGIATLLSALMVYQAYNSNFLNSPLLKIGIAASAIAGLYGLILPTQTPLKLGIKAEALTQKYLDEIVSRKLEYRIAPNNKIEVCEIPHLIVLRKKIVYVGIALLIIDKNILAKLILSEIDVSSVNPLKRELAFWQGIASVTSNNFQFWKPFTNWYIHYLIKIIGNIDYSFNSNNVFNYYIINKLKQKEFDIFESYVRKSNHEFAILSAAQLDKYCQKMYVVGHAIFSNTELTYGTELAKYEDVCQLMNLGILNVSPEIINNGLIERLNFNPNAVIPAQLSNFQQTRIIREITKICPHIYVAKITKRKLQYLPQIPSFVVTCVQHKTYLDINERTSLIEKQLQSKINKLEGDWTIIVINSMSELSNVGY